MRHPGSGRQSKITQEVKELVGVKMRLNDVKCVRVLVCVAEMCVFWHIVEMRACFSMCVRNVCVF